MLLNLFCMAPTLAMSLVRQSPVTLFPVFAPNCLFLALFLVLLILEDGTGMLSQNVGDRRTYAAQHLRKFHAKYFSYKICRYCYYSIPGYDAVQFGKWVLMLCSNLLPPFSG